MPAERTVIDLTDRFWSKVGEDPSTGCWDWNAYCTPDGYGMFNVKHRTKRYAHRLAYESVVGLIPKGLQLDHLCRNRACVNPAHLEPVTQRENLRRGDGFPGRNARKTHCPKGHLLSGANVYVARKGTRRFRHCRACHRERDAARKRYRRATTEPRA
jgi:hypothetical protein